MRENTPPRVQEIEDDDAELVDDDNMELLEILGGDDATPEGALDDEGDDFFEVGDNDEDAAAEEQRSPVQDDALLTFDKHAAPVFACCLHPQRPWAVTGGEDDRAYVWHTQTGELLFDVREHKDTVTEAHFNHDGTYLATGDLGGELLVHKLQEATAEENGSPAWQKVWSYSMGDMSWLRWHNAANVLLAGSESGEIYVWRIPAGDCKILPGAGARCEAGQLSGDGKKLYAAYSNGHLKLWDLKSCAVVMEVDGQHPMVHQQSVLTVACDKQSPLYLSGGEDGKILFCTNNGPVGAVDAGGLVECIAFSPSTELRVAASGTLDGQVAIWDIAKYSMRTLCERPEAAEGITKLIWISDYTLLVATTEGNIYGYDARTGGRKFTLSGHMADVYEFFYDPKESILLSVSEDYTAKIFKVPQLGD